MTLKKNKSGLLSTTSKSSEKQKRKKSDKNGIIEIVVLHHKELFDILDNRRRFWKFLLLLFTIIVIILGGLAFIAMLLKQQVPYNTIKTTAFGASIIQNEEKDVIYWLYNTSDLWSNSGIQVRKGDEITIRSSGAAHTALHHLVDNSNKNEMPDYDWIDTNGSKVANKTHRDTVRSRYRLYPSGDWGMLLMKILTEEEASLVANWKINKKNDNKKTDSLLTDFPFIEPIGKERRSIIATRDGYLHFALNDIVLTKNVILEMYDELLNDMNKIEKKVLINDSVKKRIIKAVEESVNDSILKNKINIINKDLHAKILDSTIVSWVKDSTKSIQPGKYPGKGKTANDGYPFVNDFFYYKENGFKDAWYADNIGSFLLVIEIKRKK